MRLVPKNPLFRSLIALSLVILSLAFGTGALGGENQDLESECPLCLEGDDHRSRLFNGQLSRILEQAKGITDFPQELKVSRVVMELTSKGTRYQVGAYSGLGLTKRKVSSGSENSSKMPGVFKIYGPAAEGEREVLLMEIPVRYWSSTKGIVGSAAVSFDHQIEVENFGGKKLVELLGHYTGLKFGAAAIFGGAVSWLENKKTAVKLSNTEAYGILAFEPLGFPEIDIHFDEVYHRGPPIPWDSRIVDVNPPPDFGDELYQ